MQKLKEYKEYMEKLEQCKVKARNARHALIRDILHRLDAHWPSSEEDPIRVICDDHVITISCEGATIEQLEVL